MIIELMRDIVEFYGREVKEIRESRTYQENPDYNRISKLDSNVDRFARARFEIASDPENFIINEPELEAGKFKSITIKPLDISKYVKSFCITPFQIFMSATIDKPSFCENMGFSSDEIAFVDTPRSPFPLENRKVEFLNTARLSYKSPKVNENRVWLKIDKILSKHKNQKGLILTRLVKVLPKTLKEKIALRGISKAISY